MNVNESTGKITFFTDLYAEARSAATELHEKMRLYKAQYKGSTEIDGSDTPAKQIRNITYELVESQVTGYIPTPSVTPLVWSEKNERNAKSIENLLRAKRNELPFEKMNDLDERFSPIYGGSVWLVEWDESIVGRRGAGDVKVTCIPPHRFVGQPDIYEINDMEYCFITFETTPEEIMRKYGKTVNAQEDGGFTASTEIRVGQWNSAVLIEDLRVDETNRIRIVLRNMTPDVTMSKIRYFIYCYDNTIFSVFAIHGKYYIYTFSKHLILEANDSLASVGHLYLAVVDYIILVDC